MQSADSLLTIVDDILDLSKVEAGRLDLEMQAFGIQDLINSTRPIFEQTARNKGVELEFAIAPGCPRAVVGDAVRVRQVLFNLVGNAVKFTPKGSVKVTVHRLSLVDGDWLLFEVSDTGIGIPESHLDRIFDAFSQVEGSSTRQFGGTGLGLSISRNFVRLMGGELTVESVLGHGSVFSFTIPLRLPEEPAGRNESGERVLLANGVRGLNVLVVDDNEINLKTAKAILERMGHFVHVARDGLEALEALERKTMDLALMDIHMPAMDGWETTRAIRKKEEGTGARIPILALTALELKTDGSDLAAAGMDGCVRKPIEISALHDQIQLVARRYALFQAKTSSGG